MASSGKTELAVNHFVLKGNRIQPPYPEGTQTCVFGTGCFWGSVSACTANMYDVRIKRQTHIHCSIVKNRSK